MKSKPIRIVLDTNLWISFLISNNFHKIEKQLEQGKCILLFNEELLSEFIEVTGRPKLKKYFSVLDVNTILSTIHQYAEFIETRAKVEVCRDEKDNFLLGLAEDGKADFLITGDSDLLVLKKHKRTKIVQYKEYIS